ncbi:laminin subunit gamma-1 [Engraulis encrasicolus]|uniref:laminin subunit gamma-1 n=1 Tax=Engraulis encrasicolus TaxID=184585 RepID=UPI002FD13D79
MASLPSSSASSLLLLRLILVLLHTSGPPPVMAAMDTCYDDEGLPSRCMPKFENAAFNRTVMASNACGSPPEDYCMQTGSKRFCHSCDAGDPARHHGATYLTDFHTAEEPTWWQSQSMYYGVQHPNSVNLTLHLGKAFEITYVRLKFYTSRPESFAIYKRTEENGPWQPYQFYSGTCRKTYGRDPRAFLRPGGDERTALCTDEFSDISPLTGGNVAFSTLEGRPSAYNFDQSPVLQDWVTATDLLISLDRLNTFGDEFFKDAKVLRSYFYAISDFSVGGRCKCNGHASECVAGESGKLECVCEHNTTGADCQLCAPFHHDRPWARATADSANQCIRCNCSGHADECVFDAEQYRSTGSGGRCVGCRDHTAGPHCEACQQHYHRLTPQHTCRECNCNAMGSVSLQCNAEGVCSCREHVTGVKCDVCEPGFHSLSPAGCRPCECDPRGSVGVCSAEDGRCHCKPHVEGHNCDRCRPGTFNLQEEDPEGCQTCFCFGHSLACHSSNQHAPINITSDFLDDADGWTGRFSDGHDSALLWKEGEVYLLPFSDHDMGYYTAPGKFLGNQLMSYGQSLWIRFLSEVPELLPQSIAVVIEGSGMAVTAQLHSQADQRPRGHSTAAFTLRLKEREMRPLMSAFEFQRLLSNVTALQISNAGGLNYTSQLAGVILSSARPVHPGPGSGSASASWSAPWVEECQCPAGFAGRHCELCARGFTREVPGTGPYTRCVPCNCHGHGDCHPETGECTCSDFTSGPTCERCLDGYYGNALIGSAGDCQPCPCPDRTSCSQLPDTGDVVCTNCPAGQRGTRCELCEDGFYGDPLGLRGVVRPCVRCDCHGNVDVNAVGVCDHVTGRCLKCLGDTAGEHCQLCRPGFYGNAVDPNVSPFGKCKPCNCNAAGTSGSMHECHPVTGMCRCLAEVTGRDCSQCEPGFYNLIPGLGCQRCNCNPVGSSSPACHPITGQCVCRMGVQGTACDSCRLGYFGFSSRGCRACNCDPMGSVSMQCHGNGTCPCRHGFVGYKCDRCELNYFHSRDTHQCEECPVCYSLIRDQAAQLKSKMQALEKLLSSYDCRNMPRHFPPRQYNYVHQPRVHQPHVHQPDHHVHQPDHHVHQPDHHRRQPDHHERQQEHHGRQQHVHEHESELFQAWRHNLLQEYRDEDYLPNSLEDFLAIQEAREAFIRQFSQLETSAQTLELHLRSVAKVTNCSLPEEEEKEKEEEQREEVKRGGGGGGEKKKRRRGAAEEECDALRESVAAVSRVQAQLETATGDLGNMVIPFSIPKGPNEWNAAVNKSHTLAQSHVAVAERMESIAMAALSASRETHSLLLTLLQGNATEMHIQGLAQRLSDMQELKASLSSQVNESLQVHATLQEQQAEAAAILKNISSSMLELRGNSSNTTTTTNPSTATMVTSSTLTATTTTTTTNPPTATTVTMTSSTTFSVTNADATTVTNVPSTVTNAASTVTNTNAPAATSSSLPDMKTGVTSVNQSHINQTSPAGTGTEQGPLDTLVLSLDRRVLELDALVRSKEEKANTTRAELQPDIQQGQRNIKTIQEFQQLTGLAEGLKVSSLSSVVKAKEVESEASVLRRNLEGMHKEWPRKQSQTKAAVRKAWVLEEKLLQDVGKKVKVAERAFRPAQEDASQARDTATQAEANANTISKNAKATLTQTRQAKRASAQLRSSVEQTEQQLSSGEQLVMQRMEQALAQQAEPEGSLGSVLEKMEMAKHQLESYTHTLAELLGKLGEDSSLERFEGILAETASRLTVLRRGVESPALSRKIQTLRSAAQEQQKSMARLDQSILEIRQERASLQDIVLTLPKSCP